MNRIAKIAGVASLAGFALAACVRYQLSPNDVALAHHIEQNSAMQVTPDASPATRVLAYSNYCAARGILHGNGITNQDVDAGIACAP